MLKITYPESLTFTLRNTPIQYLSRTSERLAPHRLWLKRDDLTGLELSGNKVRKLDFLMQEALEAMSTSVFTCGGIQSNHCRATAFMAARLGLKCRLYLRGEKPEHLSGNHFLDLLAGAQIIYVSAETYQNIDRLMADDAALLNQQGEKVFVIPEGGSNATGVWGYIRCFDEIVRQTRDQDLEIDTIVVATGSGGTHAGLLIGKILHSSPIGIVSVNVCDNALYFENKIIRITEEFSLKYKIRFQVAKDDIRIIDGFVGEGYGIAGQREIELIKRIGKEEGLILDPVYGAKAFSGLEYAVRDGKISGEQILFIHTGGIFGLFPSANRFE
jgi:D-cysteine desulfhydrase